MLLGQNLTAREGIFPGQIYSTSSSSSSTHVFDEELRKVFMVLQAFLQLSYEETDGDGRGVLVS